MAASSTLSPPQPMQPHGLSGRIFGMLMERLNRPAYERAASTLHLPPDGSFLEIGFGTGRLLEMVSRRYADAFIAGIDPSPLMVTTAKRRLDRRHVARDIREGNAEYLPWEEDSFDAAAALHCFQFWRDPVAALCEVQRILRPGGTFVLVLRSHEGRDRDWLPNPWSRTPHEVEDALRLLRSAGFDARREANDAGRSPVIVATV